MNHYPHHLGDYAKDTVGLTQGEHGAYRLLMDASYSIEDGIPLDEIYAISKATTREERRATDKVIRKYFKRRGRRYHQKRIDEEIAAYRVKSAKAAASANRRWGRDAGDEPPSDMRTHSDGNAKAMLASSQQPATGTKPQQLLWRLSVTDWRPTPDAMEAAQRLRPDLDLHDTLRKFTEFYTEKRKTKNARMWSKAFIEWVEKEDATKGNGSGNGKLSDPEIEARARELDISTYGKSREECLQLIRKREAEQERDATKTKGKDSPP